MTSRTRAAVIVGVVLAAAVLYTARLDRVPSVLSTDETAFALQAHSIATTLHDTNGRLLPLYFQMFENVWFHPAIVYCMTPVLAIVRPLTWAVRLPTAMVALCNILLVFVLARRLGASFAAAVGGAVLLALTPAHIMHGRFAADYLFPVPCVLAWLILLTDAVRLQSQSSWRFVAAGCALGLGLYTYIAALALMPAYLFLTYLGLLVGGVRRARPYALVTAGFLLAILPLAVYLVSVPQVYAGFVARYGGTNVDLDVLHHPGSVFSAGLVAERWPVYRSFFEWPFLFERAETHVMSSTYQTGIFLKATKVLLPIGLYQILRNRRSPFTLLLLATFLAAPLAASLIPEKYAIDRALVLVPTAAVIAAFGVDWLLMPRIWFVAWPARAACLGLFVWMGMQFNDFYREYMTTYPIRAQFWFDGNHPGAFDAIVSREGQHPPGDARFIYLSTELPRIKDHWTLYLLSHRRKDLLKRTIFFSQEDIHLNAVRPGSLLLTGTDDPVERSFAKLPAVSVVARITEPDGSPAFTIFERTRWADIYRFDGTYSAKVAFACAPGDASSGCASLPTTISCPSLETITVASTVVLDSCGYLKQAVITDEGVYSGGSTTYGIPVTGTFATTGSFELSGNGTFGKNRYELTFTVTKRE